MVSNDNMTTFKELSQSVSNTVFDVSQQIGEQSYIQIYDGIMGMQKMYISLSRRRRYVHLYDELLVEFREMETKHEEQLDRFRSLMIANNVPHTNNSNCYVCGICLDGECRDSEGPCWCSNDDLSSNTVDEHIEWYTESFDENTDSVQFKDRLIRNAIDIGTQRWCSICYDKWESNQHIDHLVDTKEHDTNEMMNEYNVLVNNYKNIHLQCKGYHYSSDKCNCDIDTIIGYKEHDVIEMTWMLNAFINNYIDPDRQARLKRDKKQYDQLNEKQMDYLHSFTNMLDEYKTRLDEIQEQYLPVV